MVEVVGGLVCRGLSVSNITAAALYRPIDRFHPTVLLDELPTSIDDDPELRGGSIAGHTRDKARSSAASATTVGRLFSTWRPKLVAMIGLPKDTVLDRSIVIRLERGKARRKRSNGCGR